MLSGGDDEMQESEIDSKSHFSSPGWSHQALVRIRRHSSEPFRNSEPLVGVSPYGEVAGNQLHRHLSRCRHLFAFRSSSNRLAESRTGCRPAAATRLGQEALR